MNAKKKKFNGVNLDTVMIKCAVDNMDINSEEFFQMCLAKMNSSHRTHCCQEYGCKYGDVHCPVANGFEEAAYECEDCDCTKFHPETRFDKWWESLTQEQKETVFNDLYGEF